jgi:hypothetical protein
VLGGLAAAKELAGVVKMTSPEEGAAVAIGVGTIPASEAAVTTAGTTAAEAGVDSWMLGSGLAGACASRLKAPAGLPAGVVSKEPDVELRGPLNGERLLLIDPSLESLLDAPKEGLAPSGEGIEGVLGLASPAEVAGVGVTVNVATGGVGAGIGELGAAAFDSGSGVAGGLEPEALFSPSSPLAM